jgi:hypothetical protein
MMVVLHSGSSLLLQKKGNLRLNILNYQVLIWLEKPAGSYFICNFLCGLKIIS